MGLCTVKHLKKKPWEYLTYQFAPNIITATRNVPWYDEERFEEIRKNLKEKNITFFYDPSTNKKNNHKKQSTMIEVYAKYPKEMPFKEKVEALEKVMENVSF